MSHKPVEILGEDLSIFDYRDIEVKTFNEAMNRKTSDAQPPNSDGSNAEEGASNSDDAADEEDEEDGMEEMEEIEEEAEEEIEEAEEVVQEAESMASSDDDATADDATADDEGHSEDDNATGGNKDTFDMLINTTEWDINSLSSMSLFNRKEPHVLEYLSDNISKINVLAVVDERGRSPLHCVVSNLKSTGLTGIRMIKALLANGADPSAKDVMGVTPLHLTNSAMVTRLLCDSGSDILAADRKGVSVLAFSADDVPDVAARINGLKAKVAEGGPRLVAMRDTKDGATAVLRYANHDSRPLYQAALGFSEFDFAATAPPIPRLLSEEVDNHGKTILHYATAAYPSDGYNSTSSLVAYLIESKKCLPTDVDDEGQTALHYGSHNYPEALAAGGWSPNLKDKKGLTPLDICLTEMPGLCFFDSTLSAFSGLPTDLLKAYDSSNLLLNEGAAEAIVAAIVKAEEDREASGSLLVPIEHIHKETYAFEVAENCGDYDVIDEVMTTFALIDVRARILHQFRSKKLRCEVAATKSKKGDTLKSKKGSNPPPALFTEITDGSGMTAIEIYDNDDADDDWTTYVPEFFEKVLPIIDSLK